MDRRNNNNNNRRRRHERDVLDKKSASSVSSLSVVAGSGLTASTSSRSIAGVGANLSRVSDGPTNKTNESELDFIGTSNAVKKLFSMSLDALSASSSSIQTNNNNSTNNSTNSNSNGNTTRKPTLLAIHNFEGTLIIDEAEDESNYDHFRFNSNSSSNNNNNNNHYGYGTNCDYINNNRFSSDERLPSSTPQSTTTMLPPSSKSLALALSPENPPGNMLDRQASDAISMLSNIVRPNAVTSDPNAPPGANKDETDSGKSSASSAALLAPPGVPREYVRWKFQDLNMLLGHEAMVVRPSSASSPEAASSGGGGIAVRVEDVEFLRSVWEAFQKQQLRQQQPRALLGGGTEGTRSYAQALLRQDDNDTHDLSPSDNDRTDDNGGSLDRTDTVLSPGAASSTKRRAITAADDDRRQRDAGDETDDSKNERGNGGGGFSEEFPLQTCIVPFPGPLGSRISPLEASPPSFDSTNNNNNNQAAVSPSTTNGSSPALSIVLDAYLDNLMANVPQLALCLEEKGLIQSVKMLPTEEIPSMMLHPSTLDTSRPLDVLPGRSSGATRDPTDGSARGRGHLHRSSSSKLEEAMFSPQIMEMNASALLRFLKTNCTRNHATYLLRHDGLSSSRSPGDDETGGGDGSGFQQNIHLYDISLISSQKQKKWIWWLATMSHRFALRLRHLETSSSSSASSNEPSLALSESQKRAIRDRQRSLFQQTLDLLQDLMDIDGNAHESMVASVREHMADTYLSSSGSGGGGSGGGSAAGGDRLDKTLSAETLGSKKGSPRKAQISSEFSPSPSPQVVTAAVASAKVSAGPSSSSSSSSLLKKTLLPLMNPSRTLPNSENSPFLDAGGSSNGQERRHRQPYAAVSIDALNKAQDHLLRGVKTLSALFERETKELEEKAAMKRSRRRQRKQKGVREEISRLSPAIVTQLFGMNFKLVNISLRLAEHHLGNYYSSSAMQALRTAARQLNDAAHLLDCHNTETRATAAATGATASRGEDEKRRESLQLQYIWLLEHCGHFARSFASDELWRDRGHASGEDVISVLSDVETVFVERRKPIGGGDNADDDNGGYEANQSSFWKMVKLDVLLKKSKGKINLQSLSGVVAPSNMKASQTEEAIEAARAVLAKEKILRLERRKVLVASCVSYSRAIAAFQYTVTMTSEESDPPRDKVVLLNLLRQRLGDACNETGKVLLAALRTLLINSQGGSKKKNEGSQLAAEALLDSAEFWFTQGLDAFGACGDTRNLALLRCNLCQSHKLRANSGFSKRDASSSSKHAEDCLQKAADQLLTAHEDLNQRDTDPQTWDMVSEELAATFLVLGVRRRQSLLGSGNAPVIFQVMRLSPGEERSIVDPMERALKIYEQSDNTHQAAAVHYQLALTFSKLWTCQINETNTRKKLSKAFGHYSSAFDYFSVHSRGNEPTFCLLCLDLASLYAAIPGEEGLIKSLGCCLDCCDTFSMEAIRVSTTITASTANKSTTADWYGKMQTIADSVDDRVFKLLRSLVKIDPVRYKDLYREGLTAKMVRNVPDDEEFDGDPKSTALLALHEVLLAIKKMYGVIVSK